MNSEKQLWLQYLNVGIGTILSLKTIDQSALRVLEHIIHSNKLFHLDQQRILTDVQHGFCKSKSCETQMIKTVNEFAKSLNEGQ